MNQSSAPNESTSVSERTASQSKLREFGLPLSRRQTVLVVGLAIVVAVVLWRRRVNARQSIASDRVSDSENAENGESAEAGEDTIYVPQDPDDELEKDAVVIDALRSRGRMGGG